jgi:hypothetical protein
MLCNTLYAAYMRISSCGAIEGGNIILAPRFIGASAVTMAIAHSDGMINSILMKEHP